MSSPAPESDLAQTERQISLIIISPLTSLRKENPKSSSSPSSVVSPRLQDPKCQDPSDSEIKILLSLLEPKVLQKILYIDYSIPVERNKKYRTGTYTGQVKENIRTGVGIFLFMSGEEYHGSWLNDLPSGYGLLRLVENTVYEGEFAEGLFNGDGTYKSPSGSYEGTWKNGLQDGAGKEIIGKYEYNGGFSDGKKHGLGIACVDNLIFEGKWRNGDFVKGKVREKEENECLGKGRWRKGRLKRFTLPVEVKAVLKIVGEKLSKGKLLWENRPSIDVKFKVNNNSTLLTTIS
jgi:hypothetical protein